ncbi:Major facilitator superfamily MFS_1 [Fictibacillus macauensis ZFHKF-1]|uniref:Lysosomal dipeptide transporter MFSD1 n=1 Tax=Fictibacillus macauensis ZFHKF-1 TaxID=1196324 RepID=I8J1M5_9BACL|nr:MFS transporter [Fictibacillus macauensis]EIT85636.1 Major facilitator superfamily MFS_1 [Fictibacillus macauensis ZFHKF-1]
MNKQTSRYRWIVFGVVLFAYFVIVSQRTAPGLITDQLMKDFGVSASVIGLMSGLQFFAYAGLQIPVGLLSDRYGPTYFLVIGTLINGIGALLLSVAPNEYVLLLSRFLAGTGDAAIFVNVVLLLNTWFTSQEFVRLLGLVTMAGSLGSLTATVPYSMWMSVSGWRMPFATIAITLCVTSYFIYLIVIAQPKKRFKESVKQNKPTERERILPTLKALFSEKQAWATFLCHFGLVGTYIGFIGSWGVPYGIHVFGMNRPEASQLMMYGLFGAMLGGPLVTWIASRLGAIKKVYMSIHFLVVLSWMGLFFSGVHPSFTLVVVLLCCIGIGNGASGLTFAIVRASFSVKKVGAVSGFANMGGFLSAVLLPSFFGKVLDAFPQTNGVESYHYGLLIPAVFSIAGLLGSMLIVEQKKNRSSEEEKRSAVL